MKTTTADYTDIPIINWNNRWDKHTRDTIIFGQHVPRKTKCGKTCAADRGFVLLSKQNLSTIGFLSNWLTFQRNHNSKKYIRGFTSFLKSQLIQWAIWHLLVDTAKSLRNHCVGQHLAFRILRHPFCWIDLLQEDCCSVLPAQNLASPAKSRPSNEYSALPLQETLLACISSVWAPLACVGLYATSLMLRIPLCHILFGLELPLRSKSLPLHLLLQLKSLVRFSQQTSPQKNRTN